MKTEQEINQMIKHFEEDANDKEETAERQNMYNDMVKALRTVVNSNEQEINDLISKCNNQAMINALKMVIE